jgi:hypothetical protein
MVHRIVSALVIVAVVAGAAWYFYQKRQLQRAGIVSQEIVHNGDTWKADFVARIPAPEKQVFDVIEHVENSHSGNVKSVRIVDQNGNHKTVEMVLAGPAGQTITSQVAFEYFPADGRITYHTLNSPVLDTQAEYQLDGDGPDTVIKCHESTRMLQSFPVPDAVVKQVISGLFVSQISGLRDALHITTDDEADDAEP